MSAHAMLSASGASRWLICTPSARLEQTIDEIESNYADEGTVAHRLAELLIKHKLKKVSPKGYADKLDEIMNTEYYSEEMHGYVEEYAEFVMDTLRAAEPGTILFQEQRLELEAFIPEGFGTTDIMMINPKKLYITDYKHGKGVPVSAVENSQIKVYALGALKEFDFLYNDIKEVEMTIYQPRIENVSTYIMTVEDLMHWGYSVLKPTAQIAYEGLGEFIPGEHCQFCRARPVCKATAVYNLQLAAKTFEVTTMTDEQLVKVLKRASSIKKWVTAVEKYMLHESVVHGKKWPGVKLVQGRSVRKYVDEEAIVKGLVGAGYAESKIVKRKLTGITELSKIVAKLDFQKVVDPQLLKPDGAPTLVDEEDARPEFNASSQAMLVFEEIQNELG